MRRSLLSLSVKITGNIFNYCSIYAVHSYTLIFINWKLYFDLLACFLWGIYMVGCTYAVVGSPGPKNARADFLRQFSPDLQVLLKSWLYRQSQSPANTIVKARQIVIQKQACGQGRQQTLNKVGMVGWYKPDISTQCWDPEETLLRNVVQNSHVTWLQWNKASGVLRVSKRGIAYLPNLHLLDRVENKPHNRTCLDLTPTKYKSWVNAAEQLIFLIKNLSV